VGTRNAWTGCWLLLTASGAAGCPQQTTPASQPPPAIAQTEEERVQALVDSRYAPGDVRHSFRAKWGDAIDCIDFFAQPGVRALAARGHPLARMPESNPPSERRPGGPARPSKLLASEDFVFRGEPDEDGHARRCPPRTVPIVRVTRAQIERAGGLAAILKYVNGKAPPPSCTKPAAGAGSERGPFSHVIGTPTGSSNPIVEGHTITTIWAPAVTQAGDHSTSQLWMVTGCERNATQSIEVGWNVDPVVNNGDTSGPHLFVFASAGGPGCYDGFLGDPSACPSWVQVSGTLVPGMQLPSSNLTVQHELSLRVAHHDGEGWAVFVAIDDGFGDSHEELLGYYAESAPAGAMQPAAEHLLVGAEVESVHGQVVPMGSGQVAAAGYPAAAYHRDVSVTDRSLRRFTGPPFVLSTLSGAAPLVAQEPYSIDNGVSAGPAVGEPAGDWRNYFYFGGGPCGLCGHGYGCDVSGQCRSCGGDDQWCCPGAQCDTGFTCSSAAKCTPAGCGRPTQPCCAHGRCGGALVCSQGVCAEGRGPAAPGPSACGGQGQPCCAGGFPCQAGLSCHAHRAAQGRAARVCE
jgi:hypothetical protein